MPPPANQRGAERGRGICGAPKECTAILEQWKPNFTRVATTKTRKEDDVKDGVLA